MKTLKTLLLACYTLLVTSVQADETLLYSHSKCDLEDGVYRAKLTSGRFADLEVADGRLVTFKVWFKRNWVFRALGSPDYDITQFQRITASCSGNKWLFAWTSEAPEETDAFKSQGIQYYRFNSGFITGSYDPEQSAFQTGRLTQRTNNLSIMAGAAGADSAVSLNLKYENSGGLGLDVPAVEPEHCTLPRGIFKANAGKYNYYLDIVDTPEIWRQEQAGFFASGSLEKLKGVQLACEGGRVLAIWEERYDSRNKLWHGYFIGTTDNQRQVIMPLPERSDFRPPHDNYEPLIYHFERVEVFSDFFED